MGACLYIREEYQYFSSPRMRPIQVFEPFTLSQVMCVETTCSDRAPLPRRSVLKLIDPRFSQPSDWGGLNTNGWTRGCDRSFKEGLRHVRNGVWPNYWMCLGAPTDIPIESYDEPCKGSRIAEFSYRDWVDEMDRWKGLRMARDLEVAVYRRLQPVQGNGIPRLYGTCQYIADDGTTNMDPFISSIPGLLMEYVEGTSMNKLVPGVDISEDDAERASQGILATLRRIREKFVIHNDLHLRNFVMRPHDPDHPAVIDFGSAQLRESQDDPSSQEEWIGWMAGSNVDELFRARKQLAKSNYHNPSPVPEEREDFAERHQGYLYWNGDVEELKPAWRDQYYERVENVLPEEQRTTADGEVYTWHPPRWQIKAGVRTANASADYDWGKVENYEMLRSKELETGWISARIKRRSTLYRDEV